MERRATDVQYITALEARVKVLEQLTTNLIHENKELATSAWFGCLTRNGLDQALKGLDISAAWFVFFDVDKLKSLNDKHGKAKASRLISECITPRAGDLLAVHGQWFSGDEFAAVLWSKHAAIGYAQRVQAEMHKRGFSATFAILCARDTAHTTLVLADQVCNFIKQEKHIRDVIIDIDGG